MKWFKHDADAHRDPKLRKLVHKYGVEAYGLYFYCLELISHEVTTQKLTFELEHDSELLAHDLRMGREKVEDMMCYMVDLGLFENIDGRIVCMKMLHRIDLSQSGNPDFRKKVAQLKVIHQSGHSHDSVNKKPALEVEVEDRSINKRFKKPTVTQVTQYITEKGYDIDPQYFHDYHEARDWVLKSGQKVKCWKATIRTWARNSKTSKQEASYL